MYTGRPRFVPFLALLLTLPLLSAFYLIEPKIIGGEDENNPPNYIVHLEIAFDQSKPKQCGGSYIGDRRVLTAAHCLESSSNNRFQQVTLSFDIEDGHLDNKSQNQSVSSTIAIFREYEFPINDVAVIFLSEDPPASVKPVQLATSNQTTRWIRNTEMVTALGWGEIDRQETRTQRLQKVDMQLNPVEEDCWYASIDCSDEGLLFAGAVEPDKDTCRGDSGGPLVLKDTNTLIGLTSFGTFPCAEKDVPGGYTRVSAFSDWAQTITATKVQMQHAALDRRQDVSEGSLSLLLVGLLGIPALLAAYRRQGRSRRY